MSDTNNIVEFPEQHREAAKKDAESFRRDGAQGGKAPAWRFDRNFDSGSQFDASESVFLARQLEHVRAGTYEVQYTDLVYDRLLPINRSISANKREYTIYVMDKVGQAEVIAEGADHIPNVEMSVTDRTMRGFMIGLGYHYTVDEVRAAMEAGIPLAANKAMLCKQQIERKVNDIALVGDSKASTLTGGNKGLLNIAETGILTYTASTGSGSGTTALGAGKSADEILADLHGMVSKPWTDSKGTYSVNTLLLPLTTRTYLASRRVGDGTNGSILDYFVGADQFITSKDSVLGLWQLEDAATAGATGAWTGKRAMAYRRDPSCVELIINQPFEQMPPQVHNFKVGTICRVKLFGLALYQPATMIRMDEI